jgi:hypothetical protein
MTEDITRISSDADWLDLREGEQALVAGKIHYRTTPDTAGIIVCLANWDLIVIEAGNCGRHLDLGDEVRITVERTEDGLTAVSIEVAA